MQRSRASVFKVKPSTWAFIFVLSIILIPLFLSFANKNSDEYAEYEREQEHYKDAHQWRFGIISDMDENSKVDLGADSYWRSIFQKATLQRDTKTGMYSVVWDTNKVELQNVLNEKGRAMELSDLTRWRNRLYACDDRTGVVYEIIESGDTAKPASRYILMDGDGNTAKGLKCEWGTVKDGKLYIGSFGKEYTGSDGSIKNENPLWVKIIDSNGKIRSEHWGKAYKAMREATGTLHPGYLFHESAVWNPGKRRWFFLPRRLSKDAYSPKLDEQKGANKLISMNEDFEDVEVTTIGVITEPTHGFSAFRFIPGRPDEIVALKTEEVGLDKIASFIMVFNVNGDILMEETQFASGVKYEGLEFLKK